MGKQEIPDNLVILALLRYMFMKALSIWIKIKK